MTSTYVSLSQFANEWLHDIITIWRALLSTTKPVQHPKRSMPSLPVAKETRSLTTDAWFLWNTALATTLSYGRGRAAASPLPKRTWAFNIKLCM
jgi:hypothetical protein